MASKTGSATGNTLRRLRPWAVIRAAIWGLSCVLFVVNLVSNATSESESAYPLKPITVIVPFNTGGESDAFARMIQHAAAQHKLLGQELVIQNIGGAGATIGSGRGVAYSAIFRQGILRRGILRANCRNWKNTIDYRRS